MKAGWEIVKPKFDKRCLVITASKIGGDWEYTTFKIVKVDSDEDWYWGLFTGDGDEWGDINDLHAERYLVLPLLT